MEFVTLKVKGAEYLYDCRKSAFVDMCNNFKGQDVEVCYASDNDKLVSEFFSISDKGKPIVRSQELDKEQMNLF